MRKYCDYLKLYRKISLVYIILYIITRILHKIIFLSTSHTMRIVESCFQNCIPSSKRAMLEFKRELISRHVQFTFRKKIGKNNLLIRYSCNRFMIRKYEQVLWESQINPEFFYLIITSAPKNTVKQELFLANRQFNNITARTRLYYTRKKKKEYIGSLSKQFRILQVA